MELRLFFRVAPDHQSVNRTKLILQKLEPLCWDVCHPPNHRSLQPSNNDLIVRLSHITLCSTSFGQQCTYNEPQQTDKTRIFLYKLQRNEINERQRKHTYTHTHSIQQKLWKETKQMKRKKSWTWKEWKEGKKNEEQFYDCLS